MVKLLKRQPTAVELALLDQVIAATSDPAIHVSQLKVYRLIDELVPDSAGLFYHGWFFWDDPEYGLMFMQGVDINPEVPHD